VKEQYYYRPNNERAKKFHQKYDYIIVQLHIYISIELIFYAIVRYYDVASLDEEIFLNEEYNNIISRPTALGQIAFK